MLAVGLVLLLAGLCAGAAVGLLVGVRLERRSLAAGPRQVELTAAGMPLARVTVAPGRAIVAGDVVQLVDPVHVDVADLAAR